MPFRRGMILTRDLVERGSDISWQDGFEKGLLAANIESGAVLPDFDTHVVNGDSEMKYDMVVSCLRGGMRLTNVRLEYLREDCAEEEVPEFVLVYLQVAYELGRRNPKIEDVLQAWRDVDDENKTLKHLRWAVDAGVRAGMTLDPELVAASFLVNDLASMCMFATHMDVPFEYFESHCSPRPPDYRQPAVLATVAKERDRLAILKAVLRSVPHSTWPDYAPVVQSFDKYAESARGLIPALRTEMTAMVIVFRRLFETVPATRTRNGTRAKLVVLPDDIKRKIVDAAARSKTSIGYMKRK